MQESTDFSDATYTAIHRVLRSIAEAYLLNRVYIKLDRTFIIIKQEQPK